MEQRLAERCASEVAQIFHLPYRRIVFGKPFDLAGRVGTSSAPQITNLRYGRVQLCATPAGRWRRCSVGTSARGLFAKRGLRILLPPSHLLAMRSRRCASEVAQIFHLLYRRIVFGEPFGLAGRVGTSSAPQITNLRYGRVQLCATPAGYRNRHVLFVLHPVPEEPAFPFQHLNASTFQPAAGCITFPPCFSPAGSSIPASLGAGRRRKPPERRPGSRAIGRA